MTVVDQLNELLDVETIRGRLWIRLCLSPRRSLTRRSCVQLAATWRNAHRSLARLGATARVRSSSCLLSESWRGCYDEEAS